MTLGFSLWWLLLLQNSGSRCASFNSCMGLVVPWHVGSSQTRDGTLDPCVGRLILNHWTTGEVPYIFVLRTGGIRYENPMIYERGEKIIFMVLICQGRTAGERFSKDNINAFTWNRLLFLNTKSMSSREVVSKGRGIPCGFIHLFVLFFFFNTDIHMGPILEIPIYQS